MNNLNINFFKNRKKFLNFINSTKRKNFYSVINTTLISNPYITDFPKEYFEDKKRNWSILQLLKSIFVFYFKMSVKLSIFTLHKIIFSLFWREEGKVKQTIIDTFILSNKVLENGKYEDSYLKGLYTVLQKRNIRYSYFPRIYGLGINPIKFLSLLNILKKEKKLFIFEYQLISYFDIFRIHLMIVLYPFQTLLLLQKNRLFNFHLIEDIEKQDLIAFTRYFSGQKLAEYQNIEKIISWSEFQIIERAFNFGYRKSKGEGKILGTQLFLNYPAYLNTTVSEIDNQNLSSPHQVLVNGKEYLKNMSNFYRLGVSFRYGEIFKFTKDSQKREKTLLLTSYLKNETNVMIEFCENLDLQIKLHPTQDSKDFQIPKNMNLVSGNLYDFFQTSKIVITTGSGTAVEAVAVGVSVIIIASQTNLTSNPLIEYGQGEIWDIVFEKKELLEKFEKLSKFRDENPKRILEISEYYKKNFFVEPTEENIIKVFDL